MAPTSLMMDNLNQDHHQTLHSCQNQLCFSFVQVCLLLPSKLQFVSGYFDASLKILTLLSQEINSAEPEISEVQIQVPACCRTHPLPRSPDSLTGRQEAFFSGERKSEHNTPHEYHHG